MKKIHKLNSKLNQAGIATLRVIEGVDELVDDTIEVTDRVHVQSGRSYIMIYTKINEEKYIVRQTDQVNLVRKVMLALSDKVEV